MKKIIKFLIPIIILTLTLTCCDKECEHQYEKEVIPATCTTDGYTTNTCSICGDSYNSDVIRATGHNIVVTKEGHPATCTESGLTDETKCTKCNSIITEQEKISIKGHNYDSWVEVTKPTTESTGLIKRTCLNDSNHIEEFTLPILNQTDYGYNYLEPTCTELGSKTYTYTIDNQTFTYSFLIDMIDHEYTSVVTKPTCTTEGYTTHTCSCSDSYIDAYVEALGHSYTTVVVTKPTCTTEGYTTYTCHCGHSYVGDETEKLPHSYTTVVTKPTCTTEGYTTYTCSCGHSYTGDVTEKAPHNYVKNITEPTCTSDGYTTFTCSCGDNYIGEIVEPVGHNYGLWKATVLPTSTTTGFVEQVCLNGCGKTNTKEVPTLSDSEYNIETINPTCDVDGKNIYTVTIGEQLFTFEEVIQSVGHTYNSVVTKPTCTSEGYTTYTCHCGHSYTGDVTSKIAHEYGSVVTDPTCTAEGYTTYTCHCGHTYVGDRIAKLGHNSVVLTPGVEATCTENGITDCLHCSRCGEILQQSTVIEALGHVDKNYDNECDNCEILCGDDIVYISTYEELVKIGENLAGCYQLTADIEITNDNFSGIGNSTNPFTGYLYGAGYKISNLNTSSLIYNNCGVINDVVLSGASISCTTNADVTMGLLTTLNSGVIKNCKLAGASRMTAACSYVIKDASKNTSYSQTKTYITGGFTAINHGDILNCDVEGSFTTIFNNYTSHDYNITFIFGGFYAGERATSTMTAYFGIIAGQNKGNIENCIIYGKNVNTFNVSGNLEANSGCAVTILTAYVAAICGDNTGVIDNVRVYQTPTMSQNIQASAPTTSNNLDAGIRNTFTLKSTSDFKNLIAKSSGTIKGVLIIE